MHEYQIFEYYPVTTAQVKAVADDTRHRVSRVHDLVSQVESAHRVAVEAVEGQLEDSVANAPTDTVSTGSAINQTAEFAAACLEYFGTAIAVFNIDSSDPRSVLKLNSAYTIASYDGFGVPSPPTEPGATAADRQRAHDDYLNDYAAARNALLGTLRAEYTRLDKELDDSASEIGQMLERGPNNSDVRTLWQAGALPPYAVLVYPSGGLEDLPLPPSVGRELVVYLFAHPDQFSVAEHNQMLTKLDDASLATMLDGYEQALRDAGTLDGDTNDLYREWIWWTLLTGMGPSDVVSRAQQEGVTAGTFDKLEGLEIVRGEDGRPFFLLDGSHDARDVARLTELMNGRQPSLSDGRRDGNDWSYDGPLWFDSDAELVANNGGALIATPEGTLMAAPGPSSIGIPNITDLFSAKGGTTWGEIFVTQGSNDDPQQRLRDIVTEGELNDIELTQLLGHERIHSEQWAALGYARFIYEYLREGTDGCHNRFEEEAGLPEGGYSCQ